MNKKAIIIGAGNIGRGFLGQILGDAGYRLVFVDSDNALVNRINTLKSYKVIVMGADEVEHVIGNISAYHPSDERAVSEMTDAQVLMTAVGPTVLHKTADYIAAGIACRRKMNIRESFTVIACENMEFATSALRSSVIALLDEETLEYCNEHVAFPDAEVSRIVMPITDENPLIVKVEEYMELVVGNSMVKFDFAGIEGIQLVNDPSPYIKRKMFTLTGHAMLGYYAYQAGYKYIYQAVYDNGIFKKVFGALSECGQGWSEEYNKPIQEYYEYITIMLRRFADTRIHDPFERICRQPIRKLSRNERFIGPALTALKHGLVPDYIIEGIITVIEYDYTGDLQAIKLQNLLKNNGLSAVLLKVCNIEQNERLYDMIVERFF